MTDPARPVFVLHEHHKPQHHFDLRLEEDGVLRSWAVPKGLPTDPGHDRLAIAVDDHDLDHVDYVDYEDEHKSIADTGTWMVLSVIESQARPAKPMNITATARWMM